MIRGTGDRKTGLIGKIDNIPLSKREKMQKESKTLNKRDKRVEKTPQVSPTLDNHAKKEE